MADKRRFLLGKGEALTDAVTVRLPARAKQAPYSFPEAQQRVAKRVSKAVREFDALPSAACPKDEVVASLTLHPQYLAKSFFPTDLLKESGLRAVGSRAVKVTPEKWTRKAEPEPSVASEVFVAGKRESFRRLAASIPRWTEQTPGASQLVEVEDFRAPSAEQRVKPFMSKSDMLLMEIALHSENRLRQGVVIQAFLAYLRALGLGTDVTDSILLADLAFLSLRLPRKNVIDVAKFSFLRVCREMPSLRAFRGETGLISWESDGFVFDYPDAECVEPKTRVAIFDGGIPYRPALDRWVDVFDADGVGESDARFVQHGLAVTSAFLFGPLTNGERLPAPPVAVDHYRVLDKATASDPQTELYKVLKRITKVLQEKSYPLVNISVGPDLPVDDDDVNPWTAALDELLRHGKTLATIAVGNHGERNSAERLNRIQPPSDCVNAVSVGSCDTLDLDWLRAPYSCVGPGRSPGLMKPEVVAFGGSKENPFFVLSAKDSRMTTGRKGTSYAAPLALRSAALVHAHIGPSLKPLALRALLVHRSERSDVHLPHETGWGRVPNDLLELVVCPDGVVTVVYQGELKPKKFIRAQVPYPKKVPSGMVTVTATICFATAVDPKDPVNYTRSGLDIFFRPDKSNFDEEGKDHPKTASFFKSRAAASEAELRHNEHKWETILHATRRFRGSSLSDPVLDIHYNAREAGAPADAAPPIPYALIVTVHAPKVPNLFDAIVTRYPNILVELKPQIEIPIVGG